LLRLFAFISALKNRGFPLTFLKTSNNLPSEIEPMLYITRRIFRRSLLWCRRKNISWGSSWLKRCNNFSRHHCKSLKPS